MSVSPFVLLNEPNILKTTLQDDIDRMRALLNDSISKYGNFTHPIVVQISQSLDQQILQAQRQLLGRS